MRNKLCAEHAVCKVFYPHFVVIGDGGEVVLGVFLNEKLVVLLETGNFVVGQCNFCVLRKIVLHNCSMPQTSHDVNARKLFAPFGTPNG